MNKKKYNQLLAEVILQPFIHIEKEDPLEQYVYAYHNLLQSNSKSNDNPKRVKENQFIQAKKKLIEKATKDYRWEHLDDAQMLYEMFYPGHKLDCICTGTYGIGKFYIQHILDIARTFLTFRDGMVSLRSWSKESDPFLFDYDDFEKIELWNHISRNAMSDLFIAACFVNFGITNMSYLYNVPNLVYLADMPLIKLLKKGVAETHMHTNAGLSYQDLWRYYTSPHDVISPKNSKNGEIWYCTLFRIFSALYIESKLAVSFEDYLYHCDDTGFNKDIFANYIDNQELLIPQKVDVEKIIAQIKQKYNLSPSVTLHDVLLDSVYKDYAYLGTSSEIILLYKIITLLNSRYDPLLCQCFIRYIRYKNQFFADKVQQTKIEGLDFFQRFYNEATEFPKVDNFIEGEATFQKYYSIFSEQCRTGNLKVLEMKIVPRIFSNSNTNLMSKETMKSRTLRQIQQIIKAYNAYIQDQTECTDENIVSDFPKIGLIYHFIKSNHSDNFSGSSCIMYEHRNAAECFDYSTMREVYIRFLESLTELLEEYPVLSDYIVGIDAASIENATEPWVFAPVFRKARSNNRIVPYSPQKHGFVQNIGFTYHVGEDFRHIVSGLRHIDEVLTHFNYRSGDRLGHAIALGVDIDVWSSNKNIVTLPIMEYLENLLWMWQNVNANQCSVGPENLEFRIMETARRIYGDRINGVTAYTLWRVYQSKFSILDEKTQKYVLGKDTSVLNRKELDCSADLPCRLLDKFCSYKNWDYRELLCTHFCPCYYEIYNKPIFVEITHEDALFYKELQRVLMKKVEQMGVYIETNPSSNMIIGDIPSIFNHPILRLNNKGIRMKNAEETCALVSINSDDPVVFSTFVANEIAYIYYALLNAGCKREEALTWIDKIRNQGIESSFIKHSKNSNEMIKDFYEILHF